MPLKAVVLWQSSVSARVLMVLTQQMVVGGQKRVALQCSNGSSWLNAWQCRFGRLREMRASAFRVFGDLGDDPFIKKKNKTCFPWNLIFFLLTGLTC